VMSFRLSCCPVHLSVRLSIHPVRFRYHDLMNGLNNFDKTDREYSIVSTDDLIRF